MDEPLDDKNMAKILQMTQSDLQNIKNRLDEKLCEYGSVELIANLVLKEMVAQSSLFHNPMNPMGKNPFGKYSAGLFLSKNNLDVGEPHPNHLNEFISLLSQYFDSFRMSLMFTDKKSFNPSNLTTFISQQEKITDDMNPNMYPHQKNDYYKHVLFPLNDYFVSKFGFSIQDAIKFIENFLIWLNKSMKDRYRFVYEKYNIKEELMKPEMASLRQIYEKVNITIEQACNYYADALPYIDSKNILTINVDDHCKQQDITNKDAFKKYLNTFSCMLGDQFEDFEDPLSENIISYKPIIKLDENTFFMSQPSLLDTNLDDLLEYLLEEEKKINSETWNRFVNLKSDYLEDKSFEFFSRVFPKKCIFKNLYYWIGRERMEIDLLVVYDNKILIIESKSGNLPSSAKREGHNQLQIRLTDLIKKAMLQATRGRNYIKSRSKVQFWNESKDTVLLDIDSSKTNYEFFFINVTLEHLGSLATSLKNIETFDFFEDNEYPWSVYLYDLDIITDLLREPIYLIHYIEQRLVAQEQHIFSAPSELIMLGYYLQYGNFHKRLLTDSENVGKIGMAADYMDAIEEHYMQGKKRPELPIPKKLAALLLNIQKYRQKYFTKVTSLILNFPLNEKKLLANNLEMKFRHTTKTKVPDGFTIALKEPFDIGFSYFTSATMKNFYKDATRQYLQRKHQMQITRWATIGRNVLDKKNYATFFIYDDE